MARDIFVEGVQVYEDGEEEYFVAPVQVNEDQPAAAAGARKRYSVVSY